MKARIFHSLLLICTAVLPVGSMQPGGCDPDGKVKFICGVVSPEDLVRVPRSDWVVASGYSGGGVHLINTRDDSATQVYPTTSPRERFDTTTCPSCPGPIDPAEKAKFSAHGLAVAPGPDRVHTLYLVHHGFRESIEIFEIDTRSQTPAFTWIGCVVAPQTAGLNSVSPLPGGGFVATSPNRRGVPAPSPENTDEVWEWQAQAGWNITQGSESQGPNGIEVSQDGRWLYVNLWPARKVMRLSEGRRRSSRLSLILRFSQTTSAGRRTAPCWPPDTADRAFSA